MSKEDEFEKLKALRFELDKILSGLSATGRKENTYSNVIIAGLNIVVPFNEKIEIQFSPLETNGIHRICVGKRKKFV